MTLSVEDKIARLEKVVEQLVGRTTTQGLAMNIFASEIKGLKEILVKRNGDKPPPVVVRADALNLSAKAPTPGADRKKE